MKVEKDKNLLEQLEYIDTGYEFKLSNFEGPIELLWHMIKETKLEITEVKLSDLTEQYLEYMAGLDELDLEKASDFIEIASTLIEIKSKSLLPREEDAPEDEEDPETALMRRIKEYDLFKTASENLKPLEDVNKFYRAPDEKVNDYRYVLGELTMNGLLDAFAKMLTRVKKEAQNIIPKKIEKDRFTVEDKIKSIREMLKDCASERHARRRGLHRGGRADKRDERDRLKTGRGVVGAERGRLYFRRAGTVRRPGASRLQGARRDDRRRPQARKRDRRGLGRVRPDAYRRLRRGVCRGRRHRVRRERGRCGGGRDARGRGDKHPHRRGDPRPRWILRIAAHGRASALRSLQQASSGHGGRSCGERR